jgi:hypothetical protein
VAESVLLVKYSMKYKSAILPSLVAIGLLAAAGSASETPRKETRASARRAASEERRSFWSAAFRPSADRPCDSTACRPQRLPWSPTAPGA